MSIHNPMFPPEPPVDLGNVLRLAPSARPKPPVSRVLQAMAGMSPAQQAALSDYVEALAHTKVTMRRFLQLAGGTDHE